MRIAVGYRNIRFDSAFPRRVRERFPERPIMTKTDNKGVVCLVLALAATSFAAGPPDSARGRGDSAILPEGPVLRLELPKSPAGSAVERIPKVATLSFTGTGIESGKLVGAAERFEKALSRTGAFDVVSRGGVDAILRRKGYRATGVCENTECMVEMGRLLGVDGIVSGDLSRQGSGWCFSLWYVDVATGKVVFSHVMDVEGGLGNVYANGFREMAGYLGGESRPQGNRTTIPGRLHGYWPWVVGGIAVGGAIAVVAVVLFGDEESSDSGEGKNPPDQIVVRW